jgi:hypothetical protein
VGAAVPENLEIALGPLVAVLAVAAAGGAWYRWRTRGRTGAALERSLDLLECWIMLSAMAAFAAVIWAAARR